jgi:hypothetical protein
MAEERLRQMSEARVTQPDNDEIDLAKRQAPASAR